MMYGFSICNDARDALSKAKDFAGSMRMSSIECPEAIERNTIFIREMINEIRDQLDAAEAKLPTPTAIEKAA
ncbi:MAG: hypothetical protein AAFY24_02025 [Pseudomonadota bacterium]